MPKCVRGGYDDALYKSFSLLCFTLCFLEFARWRHQLDVRQRVWWSLPDGGTGGEVCCLRMALLVSNKYTAVAAAGIIPAVASLHT